MNPLTHDEIALLLKGLDGRPGAEGRWAMNDPVNRPAHYCQGKVECIEAIESMEPIGVPGADHCRGNVVKYLWRLGMKGPALQDVKKARWYLNRLVGQLERAARVETE